MQALSQLNAQRDPVAALGTLRAYRFQHPNGLFRNEAAIAEIRAELILGRETEALSLLDAMHARSFAGVPQASELALLRAELLGRAERCDEALPALAPYLEAGTAGQRERALYARAACRAQLRDTDGSRADLRAYLSEFPQGRFAGRVRAQLDGP
jgi:regulator of sirC expression with transglutaminase-like and TPR domain